MTSKREGVRKSSSYGFGHVYASEELRAFAALTHAKVALRPSGRGCVQHWRHGGSRALPNPPRGEGNIIRDSVGH